MSLRKLEPASIASPIGSNPPPESEDFCSFLDPPDPPGVRSGSSDESISEVLWDLVYPWLLSFLVASAGLSEGSGVDFSMLCFSFFEKVLSGSMFDVSIEPPPELELEFDSFFVLDPPPPPGLSPVLPGVFWPAGEVPSNSGASTVTSVWPRGWPGELPWPLEFGTPASPPSPTARPGGLKLDPPDPPFLDPLSPDPWPTAPVATATPPAARSPSPMVEPCTILAHREDVSLFLEDFLV